MLGWGYVVNELTVCSNYIQWWCIHINTHLKRLFAKRMRLLREAYRSVLYTSLEFTTVKLLDRLVAHVSLIPCHWNHVRPPAVHQPLLHASFDILCEHARRPLDEEILQGKHVILFTSNCFSTLLQKNYVPIFCKPSLSFKSNGFDTCLQNKDHSIIFIAMIQPASAASSIWCSWRSGWLSFRWRHHSI